MDETTNAIVWSHTHGIYNWYGNYGNNGFDKEGVLVDLINKNDLNNWIREVWRAVDIASGTTNVGIAWLAKGQSDGTISTAALITDLWRDVNNGVHNTMVQSINSFNQLDKTVTNNANMLIWQGRDILAELSHCCCEIKQRFCETDKLILSEGQATRSLITDNRMHDLEDKLNQARLQASQLEQTNALIAALKKGND